MNPFLIVFLLGCAQSLQPGMMMSFNTSILNSLKDNIISKLDKRLGNISLPDFHKKIPFFEVNLTNSFFIMNPINSNQVNILYKNYSNKLYTNAREIYGNVSINIDYEFGLIKDHIHCDAYLKQMDIKSVIINEINNTGSPLVKVSAKLNMDPLKAVLVFTGGVTAKVLELLEPIIKVFLVQGIDFAINRNLYKWIEDEINLNISKFSVDVPILNNYFLNLELPGVPIYIDNYISIPLSGYIYHYPDKKPPLIPPLPLPLYNSQSSDMYQVFLSEYLLDSALESAFINNFFKINYTYILDENNNANLFCLAQRSPNVSLETRITALMLFDCNVSALNQTGNKETNFSVSGHLNFTLWSSFYYSEEMYFKIGGWDTLDLNFIKPEGYDVNWFIENNMSIFAFPSMRINFTLLSNGIPLPKIPHFSYKNSRIQLGNHYLGVYTNKSD